MLIEFNFEKQAGKRVQKLIAHLATEEKVNPIGARLIVNLFDENLMVGLYNQQGFIKIVNLETISEFFGKDYDETITHSVQAYLKKIADENEIPLSNVNIILSEGKNEIGAYLYNAGKYVKPIPTLELLMQFYSN